ncbi:MAG: hypothetical protein CMK59_04205 [Proteobacteria bacterium]|nr:hypothetical protein [Pseudomonadota bacterium]
MPISDKKIYDLYIAARGSAALAVGVKLGLFDALRTPLKADALAERFSLHPRGMNAILKSLSAADVLIFEQDSQTYALTEEAQVYLLKDSDLDISGLIEMEFHHFLTPEKLLAAAQHNAPSIYDNAGSDVWEQHQKDPAQAQRFTRAMHAISAKPAEVLAQQSFWNDIGKVLDVGAGSGALSIAALKEHSHLHSGLMDLSEICEIARLYVHKAGVEERCEFHSLNMFQDPFPQGYDAVLFSQILHDWNPKQGRLLLSKALKTLPSGGRILIHEKLTEPSRNHGPLANALVNLDMLVWTEGQQYSVELFSEMFKDLGIEDFEVIPTVGYWSCVVAYKS